VIRVVVDDLAAVVADAVVRPTNGNLEAITPALRRLELAAGPRFRDLCRVQHELAVGAAVVTPGGDLPAELVVHAVIMARGDKIGLNDVMPRHLRTAGEVATSVTIPVGATVSDARRQLVLRTFASTGGDASRTAKLLGVDADEVKRDMLALVNAEHVDEEGNGKGPTAVRSGATVKKSAVKKR